MLYKIENEDKEFGIIDNSEVEGKSTRQMRRYVRDKLGMSSIRNITILNKVIMEDKIVDDLKRFGE